MNARPGAERPGRLELSWTRATAWLLVTVAGLAVGGFVFHFPGSEGQGWDLSALIFGTLLGGVNGLTVGLLQAMVLRGAVARLGRHVWTMGVIVGATHGAYDGSPSFAVWLPVGAGIVSAGAVWLLLGERRPAALGAIAAGWAAGLILAARITAALGMPWSETPVGWSMEHLVAGVVTGLIFSIAALAAGFPGPVRPSRTGTAPTPIAAPGTERG